MISKMIFFDTWLKWKPYLVSIYFQIKTILEQTLCRILQKTFFERAFPTTFIQTWKLCVTKRSLDTWHMAHDTWHLTLDTWQQRLWRQWYHHHRQSLSLTFSLTIISGGGSSSCCKSTNKNSTKDEAIFLFTFLLLNSYQSIMLPKKTINYDNDWIDQKRTMTSIKLTMIKLIRTETTIKLIKKPKSNKKVNKDKNGI